MGFDSYSPQSQLMHCSKRFYLYFVRGVLSQQVRRSKTHIVIVAALATLGGCAPLAEVRETRPRLGPQYGTSPQLQRIEQQIAHGQQLNGSHAVTALGCYMAGAEVATSELRKNANDPVALRDYNFALWRLFSVIREAHLDPWTRPLHV